MDEENSDIGRTDENLVVVPDPTEPHYVSLNHSRPTPSGHSFVINYSSQYTPTTEQLAGTLLARFGVDTSVEHMKDTPKRFVQMLTELTTPEPFEFTTFEATSDEMIVLTPIPFYTLCAHHVVPFYGRAHIGYIPGGKLAGLSKFGRLVRNIAKGLWVQEELTAAIAEALEGELEPLGVAVILRGEHMCMSMRGIHMPGVVTQTAAMRGFFADHSRTAKMEFLEAIRDHK